MAICSWSSWSERPSNWSIGCGEEEGEEEGERRDTLKEGKPVVGFWRGQQRFGVDTVFPGGTMYRGCHDLQVKRNGRDNATKWIVPMLTLSNPISSTRTSLQPLAAPIMKLVDMGKNKAQAVERRNFVIKPQWTARSQNISINFILRSERKGSRKIDIFPQCSRRPKGAPE